MIHLVREGMPVGKARARVRINYGEGIGDPKAWAYTPKKTTDAEEEWRWLFKLGGYQPFLDDVPLSMTVIAYMPDPMKKPDIDNIVKLVSDSLGKGIAYTNDSQIVHLEAWKVQSTTMLGTEVWLTDKILEVKG